MDGTPALTPAVIPDMQDWSDDSAYRLNGAPEMLTHPEVLRVYRDGIKPEMHALGYDVRIESGARDLNEQANKYNDFLRGRGGRAAPPGRSAHNYGLAIDVGIIPPDGSDIYAWAQTWKGRAGYRKLHEVAAKYGLESLSFTDDPYHLQVKGWRQLAGVQQRYPSWTTGRTRGGFIVPHPHR